MVGPEKQNVEVASATTVTNGVEITEEGIAAGMVAQCMSERWISNTEITQCAVLRREGVSTGMDSQGISEGPQTSHTLVTDASVLTVESVITCMDA